MIQYDRQKQQWQDVPDVRVAVKINHIFGLNSDPLMEGDIIYTPFVDEHHGNGLMEYDPASQSVKILASNRRLPALNPLDAQENSFWAVRAGEGKNIEVLVKSTGKKAVWYTSDDGHVTWTQVTGTTAGLAPAASTQDWFWPIASLSSTNSNEGIVVTLRHKSPQAEGDNLPVKLTLPEQDNHGAVPIFGNPSCDRLGNGYVIHSFGASFPRIWYLPDADIEAAKKKAVSR
jgi:hypothetical protein